jgi:hypothetical protein
VTDSFTEIRSVFESAPSDPFDPQRMALTILWQIPTGLVKKLISRPLNPGVIYSRALSWPVTLPRARGRRRAGELAHRLPVANL